MFDLFKKKAPPAPPAPVPLEQVLMQLSSPLILECLKLGKNSMTINVNGVLLKGMPLGDWEVVIRQKVEKMTRVGTSKKNKPRRKKR